MQPDREDFRQGAKAYRNGFLTGALIGVLICLMIQKPIWTLPLVLGLVFGAIAMNRKI